MEFSSQSHQQDMYTDNQFSVPQDPIDMDMKVLYQACASRYPEVRARLFPPMRK